MAHITEKVTPSTVATIVAGGDRPLRLTRTRGHVDVERYGVAWSAVVIDNGGIRVGRVGPGCFSGAVNAAVQLGGDPSRVQEMAS